MSTRPNALGRGIGALIPGASSEPGLSRVVRESVESTPIASPSEGWPEIPIDAIDPNPHQPRQRFESEHLETLADSIRQHGVLQPVVVRSAGERYELVVGERRWRAARAAGLETIPAVIADLDSSERLAVALVENVQRRDLNAIELAHAFQSLCEAGATQDEVGEKVGLNRSTVANHMRLLELSADLQEDVEAGRIGVGHAKALLQLSNPERRRHLRDRIVKDGLSVRAAEDLSRPPVRRNASSPRQGRATRDPDLQRVVDAMRQRFQTRVKIVGDANRGRVEIEYFGAEDLQRVTSMLLGEA